MARLGPGWGLTGGRLGPGWGLHINLSCGPEWPKVWGFGNQQKNRKKTGKLRRVADLRGYFGIGVEGVSKAMNAGSLFRTAHAFGAGFIFTVAANYQRIEGGRADTSDAPANVPFYAFPGTTEMILPEDCRLVGVELLEDAIDLPSFRHPRRAAYVLGPERGSLSPEMLARCDFTVKIPTRFCINLGLAGALVMYDRTLTLGKFAERPQWPDGPPEPLPGHAYGGPVMRRKMEAFRARPPVQSTGQSTDQSTDQSPENDGPATGD